MHSGYLRAGRRAGSAKTGEICQGSMDSGQGNYLANLILYPGRRYC